MCNVPDKQFGTAVHNAVGHSCHEENVPKMYFIDVVEVSETLNFCAKDIKFREASSRSKTVNTWEITLIYCARHDAMPLQNLYDFTGNLSDGPLLIHTPKVGRWFITVIPVRLSDVKNENFEACYSLGGQVQQCPQGKAGLNCSF